ncbi:hypothetical protein [Paenibacillus xanthanilyticus]|uniref:Uncharacterized protein n=1 Tax=Paenibacillus xanthanilyticus TaxID=1783531 RepID=A0ABV8K8B4_9BACL
MLALTDKQYWLLTAAADAFRACPANGNRIREIMAHLADEPTETTDVGSTYRAAEALLADDRLSRLVLTDRMTFGAAEAYAFHDEHEDKIFIFTYKTANEAEALTALYGAESKLLAEAGAFLRRNRGAGDCRVTGRGIGGALAAYAALAADSAEQTGEGVTEQALTAADEAESARNAAAEAAATARRWTAAAREEDASAVADRVDVSTQAPTLAADASGAVQGVIFDAPGIAGRLVGEHRGSSGLVRYVSQDSWLSAVGTHVGEVRFAAEPGDAADAQGAQARAAEPFRFGPDGRVVTGEPSAIYALLSRFHRLTEAEASAPASELVLRAFAEAAGLEQEAEEQPGFVLLTMMERLTMVSATLGLETVKQQFERLVYRTVHVWKEEAGALFRSLPPEGLGERLETASASCANEIAQLTEQVYASVEAVLSALILANGDEANLVDHLQLSLEHFAEWLEERMDRLEEEMGAQLEAYVSVPAIGDLRVPEFDFQLELGE